MNHKKNKLIIFCIFLILILLVLISFLLSFYNDIQYNKKIDNIKDEVIMYLKDKYNEDFIVEDIVIEKNTYDVEKDDVYVTEEMSSSYVYTLKMSSNRLVKFDVIYVVYEDDKEYDHNKKYNIMEEGLYENYIYEYKIKEFRKEMKQRIFNIVNNIENFKVSIEEAQASVNNILVDYSLDTINVKKIYDKYRKVTKDISNKDFYDLYVEIDDNSSLIIDLEVNTFINKSNILNFQKEVKELVLYLEKLGYKEYEINYNFNNYQTASVTKYFSDDKEQIYLIFDYQVFSNVDEAEKLEAYIFDKL